MNIEVWIVSATNTHEDYTETVVQVFDSEDKAQKLATKIREFAQYNKPKAKYLSPYVHKHTVFSAESELVAPFFTF